MHPFLKCCFTSLCNSVASIFYKLLLWWRKQIRAMAPRGQRGSKFVWGGSVRSLSTLSCAISGLAVCSPISLSLAYIPGLCTSVAGAARSVQADSVSPGARGTVTVCVCETGLLLLLGTGLCGAIGLQVFRHPSQMEEIQENKYLFLHGIL